MTARQIIFTIVCSLSSALLAIGLYHYLVPPQQVIVRETSEARYANDNDWLSQIRPRTFLSTEPTHFTAAAAASTPGVVFIRAQYREDSGLFQRRSEQVTTSTGSGVIIGNDGYIVTNNHVVEGGEELTVVLSDKREFSAELIGTDPSTDLALLKIEATNLPAVTLGNSDSLLVGEWVLAVGNPFQLESTVTAGIVSAKGRDIDILNGQDRIESFIQTDAVVNPGNSGGALVNSNGELVGINTAIITRSGGYEGYSFAVPVNLVRKVVQDLKDYGAVQRGLLGAFITDVTADIARAQNLNEVAGVLITSVTDDGGAENAGLRKNDIIVKVDNTPTLTVPALQEVLGQLRPGDRIDITYLRQGIQKTARIVLKNKLNSTTPFSAVEERMLHGLGFELRNLTREELKRMGRSGVKVISIFRDSPVEATNMEPGFVITAINNKTVRDLKDALRLLRYSENEIVTGGFYENYDGEYFYSFSN